MSFRSGEPWHNRGIGRCFICAPKGLRICFVCKQPTVHNVLGDAVCERGCSLVAARQQAAVDEWRAEMRAALARAGVPA